jgi:hypothetical protein
MSDLKKTIAYIAGPLLTIYLKNWMFTHLGIFTSSINNTDATLTITSILYVLVAISFYKWSHLYMGSRFLQKFLCALYILLFVYLCAHNMHMITLFDDTYINILYDEMPIYSIWTGFTLMTLIKS